MVTYHSATISEAARERETLKYDSLAISSAGLNAPHPPKAIPSLLLSSTPDPALTAFAQLGCYRLNAARVMISLFDRRYQHIVAEALRPQSQTSSAGTKDQPEQIWLNGLTFERATSVCEHVVTGTGATQSMPDTTSGLKPADIPVSIINSLNDDARFCHTQDAARQFYAGVPIRSPTGINIGVYCMFDDKPRPQGLCADDVRFIQDMSRIVMDYLDTKRSHEWYRREQRMVRGLGSFVNGRATVSEPDSSESCQELHGTSEGLSNEKLRSLAAVNQQPPQSQQNQQQNGCNVEYATATQLAPSWTDPGISAPNGGATTTSPPVPSVATRPTAEPTVEASATKQQSNSTDVLGSKIDHVFSKAANVIREAMEVEGVLFLDATVRSYGGLVGDDHLTQQPSVDSNCNHDNVPSKDGHVPVACQPGCDVLGFSTSQGSSIVGGMPPSEFAECKELFLHRLLQRYPLGQVWNFEVDGAASDTCGISDDESPTNTEYKRSSTASRIIKIFPGARSVALIPLWDTQAGRWFAGGFSWTRTPTRTLSEENELTYFRVFGLTVMAEVARLKTRAADKAKMDMLGSISHELRSPLHGLVGAVELLRHTTLNSLQDGILRTIEASGRTLLDTIDHLLDFAKINAKQWSKTGRKSLSSSSRQQPSPTLHKQSLAGLPVQLDLLVEDVVESVFAGSSYLTKSEPHSMSFATTGGALAAKGSRLDTSDQFQGQSIDSQGSVQIQLDIEHPANWLFYMHPGAFRRIVMNLFGNALKFTKSGFIRISLHQDRQPKQSDVAGKACVVLTVSDSGKGMSEEYLRNHLFTPFSQEDQFAIGTGLGLSLVRHMTLTLGGTIDVSSKLGQGTTITVALPLLAADKNEVDAEEAEFVKSIKILEGQQVQLCGFERGSETINSSGTEYNRQRLRSDLTEAVCRDMLQMKVMPEHKATLVQPDFVICAVGDASTCCDVQFTQHALRCPYIFVCQDLASAHQLAQFNNGALPAVYEVCSQPIGPRKLARALLACRSRWQDIQRPDRGIISERKTKHSVKLSSTDLAVQLAQEMEKVIRVDAVPSISTNSKGFEPLLRQPLIEQRKDQTLSGSSTPELNCTSSDLRKPILIVDDNAINLKIMAAYLTKLKYPFTTATNGLEALQIYTGCPSKFSCLLTDISMPVMDGLESTRRIREFELSGGHSPVVVIALTGLGDPNVRQDALASGVDLFLTRPLALRGLKEALITTGLG